MARITTGRMLHDLELIAMKDCTCSQDQETGEDPTVCLVCEIGSALNDIHESVDITYKKYIGV